MSPTRPRRPRRPDPRRGGTLLEVIVAVMVFAIGLLSLMTGSLIGARAMSDSKSFAAAAVAAQSTMDSLKARGWDNISGASGSYTVKGHAVTWSVGTDDPRTIKVKITRRSSPTLVQDSLMTWVSNVDVIR
jgi:prepilin-type N-terminal cleavage/methylation domain-containing protein